MLYLNQLDYRHIPYQHGLETGGVPPERRNVATSGCGLCCLCMIVDHLTTKELPLEEAVRLAQTHGANRKVGVSIRILGPVVGQLYDLQMRMTTDPHELVEHLQQGGECIVHVRKKDRPMGLFTNGGHYMVILSTDGKEVCILDPSYTERKYETEGRKGKLRVEAPFLYCPIDTLMEELTDKGPGFYLFRRKTDAAALREE